MFNSHGVLIELFDLIQIESETFLFLSSVFSIPCYLWLIFGTLVIMNQCSPRTNGSGKLKVSTRFSLLFISYT